MRNIWLYIGVVLALVLPVAGQPADEAWLERLRAERVQAAEATLAQIPAAPAVSGSGVSPVEEPQPSAKAVPAWRQRLSPAAWRLLRASFEAEGVPAELVAVGWVESRFEAQALSPKGARGVWQLMPATARRYGLAVGGERDDRTHVGLSTRAAARYLAELYGEFGDWALALAAYNAGPERVEAAIVRARTRSFWQVRPWLPAETREYVPAVLAAIGAAPSALSQSGERAQSPPAGQLLWATTTPAEE